MSEKPTISNLRPEPGVFILPDNIKLGETPVFKKTTKWWMVLEALLIILIFLGCAFVEVHDEKDQKTITIADTMKKRSDRTQTRSTQITHSSSSISMLNSDPDAPLPNWSQAPAHLLETQQSRSYQRLQTAEDRGAVLFCCLAMYKLLATWLARLTGRRVHFPLHIIALGAGSFFAGFSYVTSFSPGLIIGAYIVLFGHAIENARYFRELQNCPKPSPACKLTTAEHRHLRVRFIEFFRYLQEYCPRRPKLWSSRRSQPLAK